MPPQQLQPGDVVVFRGSTPPDEPIYACLFEFTMAADRSEYVHASLVEELVHDEEGDLVDAVLIESTGAGPTRQLLSTALEKYGEDSADYFAHRDVTAEGRERMIMGIREEFPRRDDLPVGEEAIGHHDRYPLGDLVVSALINLSRTPGGGDASDTAADVLSMWNMVSGGRMCAPFVIRPFNRLGLEFEHRPWPGPGAEVWDPADCVPVLAPLLRDALVSAMESLRGLAGQAASDLPPEHPVRVSSDALAALVELLAAFVGRDEAGDTTHAETVMRLLLGERESAESAGLVGLVREYLDGNGIAVDRDITRLLSPGDVAESDSFVRL